MRSIQSIVRILKRPQTIPTKLTEKMMAFRERRAKTRYTPALIAAERMASLAAFASKAEIETLADEAREAHPYRQLEKIRDIDSPDNRLINSQTTSLDDCITMYVLVRLCAPQVMVETGVYYGALSAMILEAMHRNGEGRLYSIDLPIESDGLPASMRGMLVADARRAHWELILGDSRVELPILLSRVGQIDHFNHDSLHTTEHMTWEYETAWEYVRPGGVLSSHDVLLTPAWNRFRRKHRDEISSSGRVYGLGLAVKHS